MKTVPISMLINVLEALESDFEANSMGEIEISPAAITWFCDTLRHYGFDDLAAELAAITEMDIAWMLADDTPDNNRVVMTVLADGNERRGRYEPSHNKWVTFTPDGQYPYLYVGKEMDANPVIGWRELTEAEK